MQLKHVIRPAALFAAGSLATGANAATVDIAATDAGTPIYLFGSQSAQFTYATRATTGVTGPKTDYYLRSTSGTNLTSASAVTFPDANSAYTQDYSLFGLVGSGSSYTGNTYVGFRVADDTGVTRYGRVTGDFRTLHISDVTINGVPGAYVGTTPQQASAAVPEPATWATAVLGMGMVGAALRRRRRDGARQPALLAA